MTHENTVIVYLNDFKNLKRKINHAYKLIKGYGKKYIRFEINTKNSKTYT